MPTYLTAQYKDKEAVKRLGAKFDFDRRAWYVPDGKELAPFKAWLPAAVVAEHQELLAPITTLPAKGVRLYSLLAEIGGVVTAQYKQPVWVLAELLKVSTAAAGHVYLDLVDENCAARAHIWAGSARKVIEPWQKATGMDLGPNIKVLLQVEVEFTGRHGLAFNVVAIDPEYSLGDLEARKRKIIETLRAEGVFDSNRRLPAPWDFNHVLVLAPHEAAGLGDFMAEARALRELGICQFTLVHSRFQGDGACREMIHALAGALATLHYLPPDAVVVIRGGGPTNDLAWLNDLDLTRYLATLPVPVITGIGHERDRTTLDDVAHTYSDTPSKAIAHIFKIIQQRTQEAQAGMEEIHRLSKRQVQFSAEKINEAFRTVDARSRQAVTGARRETQEHVDAVRSGAIAALCDASSTAQSAMALVREEAFRHVALARSTSLADIEASKRECHRQIQAVRERADDAMQAIRSLTPQRVHAARVDVENTAGAIEDIARRQVHLVQGQAANAMTEIRTLAPQRLKAAGDGMAEAIASVESAARREIREARQAIDSVARDVEHTGRAHVDWARNLTEGLMREVIAQGPDRTLARGFVIARNDDGEPIQCGAQVRLGEPLRLTFQDGTVRAVPQQFTPKES
jgi:exodeoxyribonuclease VII large subunit